MGKLIVVDIGHHQIQASADGNAVRTIRSFSTGRHGHATPVGTHFHIFRRDQHHKSSIYPPPNGGAPMEFAQFFAPAVAFHEGSPNSQSHGCVHLTHADAQWLWTWVGEDTNVEVHVIGGRHHAPHHAPTHGPHSHPIRRRRH